MSKIIEENILRYANKYINKKSKIFINHNTFNHKSNEEYKTVVLLEKINKIRYINKFFELVNTSLYNEGVFIGCFEDKDTRYNRILGNNSFSKLHKVFDFVFHRIFSKVKFFKKIYFYITNGENRVLSKAELLGRLISCGFEIISYKEINNLGVFVVEKKRLPFFNLNPSYGILYKMPRVGKNSELIYVYKLRTMHPYSEYLHDYVLSKSGYSDTGKPADDFRLTSWGRIMRKYWIDEIPQLYNLLKGEMALVGPRPVSFRYFKDIPEDLQKSRIKFKPGCIPPYVAFNKKSNIYDVLESERLYFKMKENNYYNTDIILFFRAIYNIIIIGKRSA